MDNFHNFHISTSMMFPLKNVLNSASRTAQGPAASKLKGRKSMIPSRTGLSWRSQSICWAPNFLAPTSSDPPVNSQIVAEQQIEIPSGCILKLQILSASPPL